jgi:pyruvate/2-oxoglutarate dehydrogenase complex dihydrolipoamide acyltransferase (E2) component
MREITLAADVWTGVDEGVEALVDAWQVAEGDVVRQGQVLASVVLVKASQDIPAPADGRIDRILVKAGETFARGAPIALFAEAA